MTRVGGLLARPFAHRGLHDRRRPENSLAAFDHAIERGFGIELDVRLSADGVPFVFHDAVLGRMCGVDGKVARTPAAQLGRLRLSGGEERVPSLAAALYAIGGRSPVLVDLKPVVGQRRLLVDAVAIILRCYRGPIGVVGFDPWLLSGIRDRAPRLATGQTATVDPRLALRLSAADFVNYNVDRLPSAVVARARDRLPVVTWTVRTAAAYRRAREHADCQIIEGAAVAAAEADGQSTVTPSPVTR